MFGVTVYEAMKNRESPSQAADRFRKALGARSEYDAVSKAAKSIMTPELIERAQAGDPQAQAQYLKLSRLMSGSGGSTEQVQKRAREFDDLGNEFQAAQLNRAIASGDLDSVKAITGVNVVNSGRGTWLIGGPGGLEAKNLQDVLTYLGPGIDYSKTRTGYQIGEDKADNALARAMELARFQAMLQPGEDPFKSKIDFIKTLMAKGTTLEDAKKAWEEVTGIDGDAGYISSEGPTVATNPESGKATGDSGGLFDKGTFWGDAVSMLPYGNNLVNSQPNMTKASDGKGVIDGLIDKGMQQNQLKTIMDHKKFNDLPEPVKSKFTQNSGLF